MSRTKRTIPDYHDYPYTHRYKYDDTKPWYKPPKIFKYIEKRARKAKERNALRSGDMIPIFRKTDVWEYL